MTENRTAVEIHRTRYWLTPAGWDAATAAQAAIDAGDLEPVEVVPDGA